MSNRIVNSSINTVVISRNLFERLCEAAIEAEAQNRWRIRWKMYTLVHNHDYWLALKNEALAIRDGAK